MTKAEFTSKIDGVRSTGYPTTGHYMDALVFWHEQYIASLESENARLEKHIKNAVDDIEATLRCLPYASYIDKVRILERIKYILTAEPQEEK